LQLWLVSPELLSTFKSTNRPVTTPVDERELTELLTMPAMIPSYMN
jgi:hypothetical protein